MKYVFDVAFLPTETLKEHDCRLVIDLLRASTQITTFFDAGGETLLPVREVEESYKLKEKLGDDWKLMGERGGLPAPGFDFGNSPLELVKRGAPLHAIITTSNGTHAMMRAIEGCAEVCVACARNLESAAWDALCAGTKIGIICAGRNGEFSMEDTVCAGMYIEKLLSLAPKNGAEEMELTDGAIAAMALWRHLGPDLDGVAMESQHGRILRDLGFADDVLFCSEVSVTATVPKLAYVDGAPTIIGR
ncbi:MAG: 2-phosphosulfolactate phosphatase [Synergistaceae bacterium]|nr:2-phosphosulfolactate phosphatase [Synergistaceae bacterium]